MFCYLNLVMTSSFKGRLLPVVGDILRTINSLCSWQLHIAFYMYITFQGFVYSLLFAATFGWICCNSLLCPSPMLNLLFKENQ